MSNEHMWLGYQVGANWQRSQQSAPAGWRDLLERIANTSVTEYETIGNQKRELRALLAAAPKAECPKCLDITGCPSCAPKAETVQDERIIPTSTALIQWAYEPESEEVSHFNDGYDAARRWVKMQIEYAVKKAQQPAQDQDVELNVALVALVDADARIAELEKELTACKSAGDFAAPQPSDDAKDALVAALEALAKLGNGDRYGNSDGNVIAQEALAAYRATMGSKK